MGIQERVLKFFNSESKKVSRFIVKFFFNVVIIGLLSAIFISAIIFAIYKLISLLF